VPLPFGSALRACFNFRRLASFECFTFYFHVDLNVAVSRIDVGMSQPGFDDIDTISRLEQMHRACVAFIPFAE
jgi:hypothetical protein